MNEKELYKQKRQAQLDEWSAELQKLKAKASEASAEAKIEINKEIESLERKIDEGQNKLAELAHASEDAWESIKDGVESAWDSMRSAISDATSKFRKH